MVDVSTARLEVAYGITPDVDPAPEDWADLSENLRDGVRATLSDGSGSASAVLDNIEGALDPGSPADPLPMRHARLVVDVDGTPLPVWRGLVERWTPGWDVYDVIDLSLVDARAWVALQTADVSLPLQTTDARIRALLALAGWPESLTNVPEGSGIVLAQPIVEAEANLLGLIDDAVDAEDGWFYAAADGRLTFHGRHHRFFTEPTLAFGTDTLPVRPGAEVAFDSDSIVNEVRVSRSSGSVHPYQGGSSAANYGPRVMSLADLPISDAESEALAMWIVERWSEPILRPLSWSVKAFDDTRLAALLGLTIGDVVTFEHEPASGPKTFACQVAQIDMTSSAGEWVFTYALTPWFGDRPWCMADTSVTDSTVLAP